MLAVSAALLAAAAAATARGGHAKDQAAAADALRPLFTLDVASAAFPSVQRVAGANALVVSQFTGNPLYSGTLAYVANISAAVDAALRGGGAPPPHAAPLTDFEFLWPNLMTAVPAPLSARMPGFVVGDGFLVPLKSTGTVYHVDTRAVPAKVRALAPTKEEMFYHRGEFVDMDGDGDLDVLTARAIKPLLEGDAYGELVWLENPGAAHDDGTSTWPLHSIVAPGPGVYFDVINGTRRAPVWVVGAEFFGERVSLWHIGQHGKVLAHRVVDDAIGAVEVAAQVNLLGGAGAHGAGRHLLVSNHLNDAARSGVFAYELPANLATGAFGARHKLAGNFTVRSSLPHSASPGFSYVARPRAAHTDAPARVLVAGDGSWEAYEYTPSGGAAAPYKFAKTWSKNYDGTIGAMHVEDVNGDGYTDVFVADNDNGKLHALTYAPATAA